MRELEIKNRVLITEGWNDTRLSLLESQHIIPFVTSVERYITEANLTPDQIQQLFTGAEQGMTAGGKNRTAIGKGADVAKLPVEAVRFIDKKISELGAALKQAGPVKNIDQKFNELKAKIGEKDSKVVNAVKAVSDWAKENPGKATVAVAILTTAASMAGGPLGGAIAGFLARATKDLLQGKDLSSAVGNSIKTAAYGAIAGWALNGLGDWLEGLRADAVPYEKIPGLTQINVGLEKSLTAPGFSNVKTLGSILVPPDRVDQFTDLVQAARGGDIDSFNQLWNFSKSFDVKTYSTLTNLTNDMMREIAQQNDVFLQNLKIANDAVAAIAQGSVQASGKQTEFKVGGEEVTPETETGKTESKKFTALQIETLIEWCDDTPQVLNEGPMDALKKGAAAVGGAIKKGASAVAGKAAQVGKNITTKVTADKLNKAWIKAGSPTDSDKIADILRQAGVSDDVLAPIYKQLGAKLPAAPAPAQSSDATGAKPAPGTKEPAQGGAQPSQGGDATRAKPAPGMKAPAQGTGQPAAGQMDFKGIQQAVAKLSSAQAKELVTHIDSISKGGTAPAQATKTAPSANAQPAAQPAANAQQSAQANEPTAAPATKNAAAGDTYEKAKSDIRKVQGGQKPMPPNSAADIDAAIAKLAKGDKESGVFAAQKIMNLAKAGVDVSKQQQAWIANSKAGERFLTQSQYFEISKMLREYGLSWSDLGLRVHLLEGTNKLFGISFK